MPVGTNLLAALIAAVLHGALILAAAPLAAGLATVCRARLLGRRPPPLTQPYRDLARQLGKQTLTPDNATELYPVWPFAACAATVTAALITPGFCAGTATATLGDAFTWLGLLALASASALLAGLETGADLGGAAAARALPGHAFAAPVLLVLLLVFALIAHSTNLNGIGLALQSAPLALSVPFALALLAVLATALAAGPPDPALTREYSGRHLALMHYVDMLRRTIFLSLFAALFLPYGTAYAGHLLTWPAGILLWALKLAVLVAVVAVLQVVTPRLRGVRVPEALGAATLLGLLAAAYLLAGA